MPLSLNCKDAGDPVCTHTMYGETEEELLNNAKKHGIEVHGYTEQTWNEEIENIAALLGKGQIKKLPVERNGVLVGIISRGDVIRHSFKAII